MTDRYALHIKLGELDVQIRFATPEKKIFGALDTHLSKLKDFLTKLDGLIPNVKSLVFDLDENGKIFVSGVNTTYCHGPVNHNLFLFLIYNHIIQGDICVFTRHRGEESEWFFSAKSDVLFPVIFKLEVVKEGEDFWSASNRLYNQYFTFREKLNAEWLHQMRLQYIGYQQLYEQAKIDHSKFQFPTEIEYVPEEWKIKGYYSRLLENICSAFEIKFSPFPAGRLVLNQGAKRWDTTIKLSMFDTIIEFLQRPEDKLRIDQTKYQAFLNWEISPIGLFDYQQLKEVVQDLTSVAFPQVVFNLFPDAEKKETIIRFYTVENGELCPQVEASLNQVETNYHAVSDFFDLLDV